MASSTFEDQVEKLKEILEKFKKIVPSDSTLHKGEHCKFSLFCFTFFSLLHLYSVLKGNEINVIRIENPV